MLLSPAGKELDSKYHFSCQFTADLLSMNSADFIITSTYQVNHQVVWFSSQLNIELSPNEPAVLFFLRVAPPCTRPLEPFARPCNTDKMTTNPSAHDSITQN